MNRIILVLVCTLSAMAFGEQAVEEGGISKILVHNNPLESDFSERIVVFLEANMKGGFCAKKNWAIVLNNEAAKSQYAMLLSAYMANSSVKITGNLETDCVADYENVRNVELSKNL